MLQKEYASLRRLHPRAVLDATLRRDAIDLHVLIDLAGVFVTYDMTAFSIIAELLLWRRMLKQENLFLIRKT